MPTPERASVDAAQTLSPQPTASRRRLLTGGVAAAALAAGAGWAWWRHRLAEPSSPALDGLWSQAFAAPGGQAEVRMQAFQGKPLLLNFWATWCGPCKSELPAFDKAYKEYGEEIAFLMVNLTDGSRDTVDSVKAFVNENEYSFPVYFDTEYEGSNAYKVTSIPLTILIDKNGNVYQSHVGAMNESRLNGYIEDLMDGGEE